MTESKKRREPFDRLSELPDSLIFHIFWFLPMDNFVRTTVLSSRWKTLWTTTPYLNFDFTEMYGNATIEPRHFINRALLLWRGIKIVKYRIEFSYPEWDEDESESEPERIDFDLWMRFAVEKKVEELYLPRDMFDECMRGYKVPQRLYSCSSLKVLSLPGCYVQIKGNLQWSQLKSLTMDGTSFSNCEHVMNQVLCGTPKLEVLILAFLDSEKNLSIRSSSLRKLSIKKLSTFVAPSMHTELRIWTPNLETLEISGVPYCKCLLMNVPSLTHATLHFFGAQEFKQACVSADDFLAETLRQILLTIQHVEMVTLSGWCIKVLAHMTEKHLVSPFSNVKFLKLKLHVVGYKQIVRVLEIFPKMKMLVVVDEYECDEPESRRRSKFDAKISIPKSFLSQLKTVKISWGEGDDLIFPFIEILLKYSSNLEKMVIRVTGLRPASNSLFLASRKLLNMPRSSPNCTVDFL